MTEKITNESYNFINYLKIVDTALMDTIGFIDFNPDHDAESDDNKLMVNIFDSKVKRMLEDFIISEIHNSISYGKTNILINTCSPENNWRSGENEKNCNRITVTDKSIHVDEDQLNVFIRDLFKKFQRSGANKRINGLHNRNLRFVEVKFTDLYDSYCIIEKLLSNFGYVTTDGFGYKIIQDCNGKYMHDMSFPKGIVDKVKNYLISIKII